MVTIGCLNGCPRGFGPPLLEGLLLALPGRGRRGRIWLTGCIVWFIAHDVLPLLGEPLQRDHARARRFVPAELDTGRNFLSIA